VVPAGWIESSKRVQESKIGDFYPSLLHPNVVVSSAQNKLVRHNGKLWGAVPIAKISSGRFNPFKPIVDDDGGLSISPTRQPTAAEHFPTAATDDDDSRVLPTPPTSPPSFSSDGTVYSASGSCIQHPESMGNPLFEHDHMLFGIAAYLATSQKEACAQLRSKVGIREYAK
jgi:hypothetical protein